MTVTSLQPLPARTGGAQRFHLSRAGILNVWQYDDQEFGFADGRLLLRGANGAGKSKTLEMLLPFALDGDKTRITASAKHHTSLLWLMTDGYDGQARVGYVWVEFRRAATDGAPEVFTCGVGVRASASARTATAWHFATSRRVGHDLLLEDEAGPLSRARLGEALGADGVVFDRAAPYKEHVGRTLFGLDAAQFDEVLRLLYWLRQPQIGEDIEPAKLAEQLSQALPQLDERAVRSAGETFDELTAFGEQIERRAAAAQDLGVLADAYARYARAVVAQRARAVAEGLRAERRLRGEVRRATAAVSQVGEARAAAEQERQVAHAGVLADDARLRTLQDSPEFRDQRRLAELAEHSARAAKQAAAADQRRERQAHEVLRRGDVADRRAAAARGYLHRHVEGLRRLDRRQRAAVPGSSVPVPALLDAAPGVQLDGLHHVDAALDQAAEAARQASSAVTRRSAGVAVVREALVEADAARSRQTQAESAADLAEGRWLVARAERLAAEGKAQAEHDALTSALAAWAALPAAPDLLLPAEVTAESVAGLPALARDAARPGLTGMRSDHAQLAARREASRAEVARLAEERAAVEAERDPAPPPPALPRTARTDGRALWQVVDFHPTVDDAARAGLEAALQAAGLLDAWVRPGGLLLDPEHHDVVLAGAGDPGQGGGSDAPVQSGGLAEVLVPDVPADGALDVDDVRHVLAAIGTSPHPEAQSRGRAPKAAWVRTDGTWQLGPSHGRAAKPRAQYIGATARAQERARRLVLLDAALADQQAARDKAERELADLDAAISALEEWVAAVPPGQALLSAWTRVDILRSAEERDAGENRVAQDAAHTARTVAAQARARAEQAAVEHGLPADSDRLDAVEQELRGLRDDLREVLRQDERVRAGHTTWREAAEELAAATATLTSEQESAAEAAQIAGAWLAELEALRDSVGDSVRQLQRRIEEARQSREAHQAAERAADMLARDLTERYGRALAEAATARERLTEHLAARSAIVAGLVAVDAVPGMLVAVGVTPDDAAVIAGLAGHPPEEPLGRRVAATTDTLAALSQDDGGATATRLWRAHADAASGPAADHQPTVAEFGDLLAVTGRDDAGEAAVVVLAHRARASVERDSDLLTEKEKQQFEQHVLGELGDAIRACRRDADELVTAMNEQLAKVTTSQGIRVRLDWRLREDVPAEARAAVDLLAQPVGALLPEERTTLRDALHRLIEASRAQRPDLTYGEHLTAALDYRTWSEFTIRYTRPERAGVWDRLHRRSALSQGEQKVLCYLPLFAAAAAHFTSLAGAAPHAPRLVLLDDAFPKIDVRTHPLLFGLLVQLDLDFVVTSERLWGDHDTVPSLAIYEALRDPSQRGIAQYEYRWDGRTLHPLG